MDTVSQSTCGSHALRLVAADGRPWPDTPSPIDGPDDWFRVRMVCTLLDTTVEYLDRGQWRKRLDNFLVFFQVRRISRAVLIR